MNRHEIKLENLKLLETSIMHTNRRSFLKCAAGAALSVLSNIYCSKKEKKPNILFAIADDWSWPHASIHGEKEVYTPAFDRVAKEGILFNNCYVSAPSCTPSRGAILTGQYHWRLQEGGNLWSILPAKFKVYPDILEEHGYFIGYTGKGWGPGDIKDAGRDRNPAGKAFNEIKYQAAYGMNNNNYAANFAQFLNEKPADAPFCFWYGSIEPHRSYEYGMGVKEGKNPKNVEIPPIFPDAEQVRYDMLDYFVEIEHFDSHLNTMLNLLEEREELDNTIIVVTSDNGMPFPRAKANLYRWGTNMPLAIRWGKLNNGGRIVDDFICQTDFAPTFLEAAGIIPPTDMTGKSLMNILHSFSQGQIEPEREKIITGRERHAWVRSQGLGYPSRAIRTKRFLYIHNYHPERWPAGDPDNWAENDPPVIYGDIDDGPTKQYMINNQKNPRIKQLLDLAVGKRPEEELYDLEKDPDELVNVAADSSYSTIKKQLLEALEKELKNTNDPRVMDNGDSWDTFEYYAPRIRDLKTSK